MTPLEELEARADAVKAADIAAHHKARRRYLGVAIAEVHALAEAWRGTHTTAERVAIAATLWDTDIHEARIAAAKLVTQARIRDDEALVWAEFLRWLPTFDAWAIADYACKAGARRLVAEPDRLDIVETWITDPNKWVRCAALLTTLPWTINRHPTSAEAATRDRVIGWAATHASDRDQLVQNALGGWLRSLARHDPARTRAFLAIHGSALMSFAGREADRALAMP